MDDVEQLRAQVAQLEGERRVMQRWISEAVVELEALSGNRDFEEGGDDFTRFLIDGTRLAYTSKMAGCGYRVFPHTADKPTAAE